MKRKDAFAMQDFDEQRILQRSFFKRLNLPNVADDEIIATLTAKSTSSAETQNQIDKLNTILDAVADYSKRLLNHHDKFNWRRDSSGNRISSNGRAISERRQWLFWQYSMLASDVVDDLQSRLDDAVNDLKSLQNAQFRREFGARLKQARKAAGFTQIQLALDVDVSRQALVMYERGANEPSMPTMIRLARILRVSSDFLLGLN